MQYRLKITAIRSRFKSGGCIFTGKEVDADGDFKTAGEYYVVRVDSDLVAGIEVQQGQIVNVSGPLSKYERDVNGYWLVEAQIKAQTLTIEVPSGEQIISFIASNPNFKGIGQVKANKLWNRFNTNLINLIETNDVDQLSLVLNRLDAQCLIKEWSKLKHGASMTWLLSKDIPAKLGSRLINFYGDKLQRCLEEDSYRILSFSGDWRFTDELAISVFNIDITDARRLNAAISEALHRVFMKGSTKVSQYGLYRELSELFGSHFYELKKDIDALLKVGVSNRYYIHKDRFYHPVGAYAMECFVADKVRARLDAKETLLDKLQLERRIASFQAQKKFALNQEQLDAAEMVNSNKFSVLLGSAGSGKTTVLELLCLIYKQCGFEIVQAAISAKAAKKMESSTGLKATTIASVLYRNKKYQPGQKVVLILDEASMVDLVSMYRLLQSLPEDAHILLVGDTGQLMPIGPGLILHALAGIKQIPKVMLLTSNRFGSVIAHAANQVRCGICPQFSSDLNDPLVFIDADEDKIADIVSDLFIRNPLGVQVLSSIRKGMAGTEVLNSRCQLRFTETNPWLSYCDHDADSYQQTKFRLGDYVLCTKNMWNFELQNGSQGKIIRLLDNPRVVVSEEGYETDAIIGYIMWDDGVERALHESMLPYIDLGFAMSVHKAQGSQWDWVVIALTGNPILDRTLIYTAMTRACQKVVFVGDRKAMEKAIKNPPKVEERLVGLSHFSS